MNRTDRLTGILLALQAGRKTAADLATRFEVSRRTILRDVDALSQIGVPVVALSGATGGYQMAEGFWLAPLQLTSEEASLLLLALKGLGDDPSPFGLSRRTVEEKLRAILPADLLRRADREIGAIDVAPPHRAERLGHLTALRSAVVDKHWVRIGYLSARRQAEHDILPLRLFVDTGRWYCQAVSLQAEELRVFRIDRIDTLNRVPPPPNATNVVERATTHASSNGPAVMHDIVVELTYAGMRRLEDHPDFASCLIELDDSCLLQFSTPASELDYFARELFAVGSEALVLEPACLRDKILDLAAETMGRYQERTNSDSTVSPIET